MLSLALDKIVLRTEGEHVVARITGKLSGLLTLGELDVVASVGAGSRSLTLATLPPEDRIVA